MVNLLVWVDLVVVEVHGCCGDGVYEHENQDKDVEPGGFEDSLKEVRSKSARFVFVDCRHLPAVGVANQNLSSKRN